MADTPAPTLLELLLQAMESGQFRMPLAEHLGLRITHAEAGQVTVSFDPQPFHRNIMGTVHGGILCAAADAAMGLAYGTTVPAEKAFTTLELKINYMRPVFGKTVHAKGLVLHRGKTTGLMECRLIDSSHRMVAFATSTCMVIEGDAASGRHVLPHLGALPGSAES
ncbi:MAG: PaaI family thioesterase [Bryobacterales bacterium]|nr:PaaI family thioesterase [Bryobacterales bacterium]